MHRHAFVYILVSMTYLNIAFVFFPQRGTHIWVHLVYSGSDPGNRSKGVGKMRWEWEKSPSICRKQILAIGAHFCWGTCEEPWRMPIRWGSWNIYCSTSIPLWFEFVPGVLMILHLGLCLCAAERPSAALEKAEQRDPQYLLGMGLAMVSVNV